MKLVKFLVIILFFINCKENDCKVLSNGEVGGSQKKITSETLYSNEVFNKMIKCGDYSYVDGYFTVPDYGCIYDPSGSNNLGNIELYLLPKKKLNYNFNVEKEENKVNAMNIVELKKNYNIYLFLIDKKYLKKSDNRDVPYYPTLPYRQIIFNCNGSSWRKIKTITINDEKLLEYNDLKTKLFSESKEITNNKNNEKIQQILGKYKIKAKIISNTTDDEIEMEYNFNFRQNNIFMSQNSDALQDIYCEGEYVIERNNDNTITLSYKKHQPDRPGKSCVPESELNEVSFQIKKMGNELFIKSQRFSSSNWQKLEKDE